MESGITLRVLAIAIGSSHSLLLGVCLYQRISDLIEVAEPFLLSDVIGIFTSYCAQILTVLLLLLGATTGRLMFTIPWILLCAVVFSFGTIFAIFNARFDETEQICINFIVVGVVWAAWYTVLRFNLHHNECISSIKNHLRKYKKIPDACDDLD